MVAKHLPPGLIAATAAEQMTTLVELAKCCQWPLVMNATLRRLHQEFLLHNPECVLFWLDNWAAVTPTAKLIAWSRERGARPYRLAVAHQLADDVEPMLRAAGAHGFMLVAEQSGQLVADALWPILQHTSRPIAAPSKIIRPSKITAPLFAAGSHVDSIRAPSDLVRPP